MTEEMEKRVTRACDLFHSGYNCSQSVFTAFADLYGIDQATALRLSSSFGGGIGRMRETCGAACGMFLLAGLQNGTTDAADRTGKSANYALVQALAEEFKHRNGSLNCGELLGIRPKNPLSPQAEERTEQYYAKRPCAKMVEEGARIWAEKMEELLK